jgi:hypothetical protein
VCAGKGSSPTAWAHGNLRMRGRAACSRPNFSAVSLLRIPWLACCGDARCCVTKAGVNSPHLRWMDRRRAPSQPSNSQRSLSFWPIWTPGATGVIVGVCALTRTERTSAQNTPRAAGPFRRLAACTRDSSVKLPTK